MLRTIMARITSADSVVSGIRCCVDADKSVLSLLSL